MNALIPHKDTLLFLAKIQKKIIYLLIKKEIKVFPQYPLFSLFENEIPKDIISFTIKCPKENNNEAIFPIELETKRNKINLSMIFAKTQDKTQMPKLELSDEIKNAFPKRERIFRISNIIQKENSWQLFDDKWFKINYSK